MLVYLWYREPGQEAAKHQAELARFRAHVDADLDFRAVTYQDLFCKLRRLAKEHSAYIEYMKRRYF